MSCREQLAEPRHSTKKIISDNNKIEIVQVLRSHCLLRSPHTLHPHHSLTFSAEQQVLRVLELTYSKFKGRQRTLAGTLTAYLV